MKYETKRWAENLKIRNEVGKKGCVRELCGEMS
jgi:hypothetical protein